MVSVEWVLSAVPLKADSHSAILVSSHLTRYDSTRSSSLPIPAALPVDLRTLELSTMNPQDKDSHATDTSSNFLAGQVSLGFLIGSADLANRVSSTRLWLPPRCCCQPNVLHQDLGFARCWIEPTKTMLGLQIVGWNKGGYHPNPHLVDSAVLLRRGLRRPRRRRPWSTQSR